MSTFPKKLLFPEPYASNGLANSAHNAANTPEQRAIGPMPGPAYPPEIHNPRSTPNPMHRSTEPPRRPSAHTPAYQPTLQGSVHTHPTLRMPQVQVSTTPLGPQPQTVQRSETMYMPSHLNNAQLTPGPYSNYPLQSPTASYSLSQHSSGMLGAPSLQRNQSGWDDERYQDDQGISEMQDGDMGSKAPPSTCVSGVTDSGRRPSEGSACCPSRS